MKTVREPAVAGMFYPERAAVLESTVRELLAGAASGWREAPKALIAPHAGYVYSGPIAASAYAQLADVGDSIERVVLLGPSHRVWFQGVALCSAQAYITPLGEVPIDGQALERIRSLPQVRVLDAAHAPEHSLEVHLPFLQQVLHRFSLVPLVVGDATPERVAEVIERLWDDAQTLIVVSSDLSHYLDYETATRVDATTSKAIEARRDDIGPEQACGCRPLNGLLHLAKAHGLEVSLLDLRNSGDTAGSRDRVVGYGAYVVR